MVSGYVNRSPIQDGRLRTGDNRTQLLLPRIDSEVYCPKGLRRKRPKEYTSMLKIFFCTLTGRLGKSLLESRPPKIQRLRKVGEEHNA